MGLDEFRDGELVQTPFDRNRQGLPRESLRRSNGRLPRPPAIWGAHRVVDEPGPEAIYGRYPRGFLEYALRQLGVRSTEVLHVCSGGMSSEDARGGLRVDLRHEARPDVMADGRQLPFRSEAFAAVLLDPPYSVEYARSLYGVEYPRPSHLLAEAARVVRPGGAVALLHYLVPVPPPGCRVESIIGVTQGLGYRIRAWTVYRRDQQGFDWDQKARP